MENSDERYGKLQQLPQFPAVATKLMRVLSNDEASIQEISNLVRVDAALTSELLRLVNSPLYGFTARIGSIQKAILVLGFEEVKNHVLAASMKMYFGSVLRLDLFRAIWRHSLACALLSEELSAACSPSQTPEDRAYTAGLLHDIGRLGLFVSYPDTYSALLGQTGKPLREREVEAFGFDHCAAGGWLAAKWDLPADIQSVATGHHEMPQGPVAEVQNIVQLGIALADSLGFDLVAAEHSYTLQEIRGLLPHSAQYRFDPDAAGLKARISERLDSFD